MIVDKVRDYIKTCPLLKSGKINVNYLGEDTVKYVIDNVPSNPLIKRYTDGTELKQFLFIFGSREFYDNDMLANMDVSRFYEEFEAWISKQNNKGVLPELENGLTACSIEVLTSGYLHDIATGYARFQIQCRLIYKKDKYYQEV